ncbi:hypothetical protein X975_18583, partial [Stegodyphus mimosarum]
MTVIIFFMSFCKSRIDSCISFICLLNLDCFSSSSSRGDFDSFVEKV